jgi:hypothetical protein
MTAAELRKVLDTEGGGDTAAQVLLEHAPALVDLLAAVERWKMAVEFRRRAGNTMGERFAEHQLHKATEALLDATARLHAIGASHG